MGRRLDCRTCGACCGPSKDYETYVDIFDVDVKRLSPAFRRHAVHGETLPPALAGTGSGHEDLRLSLKTKRNANGVVCVALRGTVGRRVSCSIYDRRPTLCREFKRGSAACLHARREAGFELGGIDDGNGR